MFRVLLVMLLASLLLGCSPQRQLGFSDQQWQQLSPKLREHILANQAQIKQQGSLITEVYAGPQLNVYLLKGEAVMPPAFDKSYAFQLRQFRISPGECKNLVLKSVDTDYQTKLLLCYDGARLVMDPSRYELDKSRGTAQFDYNPIWKRGFTYDGVTTSGYTRLSNTSVSIKALSTEPGKNST